ncbi:hypothetical protein HHK36_022436 [Tetracentron sinense]|uniref:RRM domain-containing protein n=1 Tax=Tetracentron sinense TaxID=13715 RepID=A0A834YMX5_TETSI|nr:hypothetical protein HHK36_022436 [Tetracentron sinense]
MSHINLHEYGAFRNGGLELEVALTTSSDKEEPRLGARQRGGVADDFDEVATWKQEKGQQWCGAAAMPEKMKEQVVVQRALSSVEQLKKLNAGRSFEAGGNIKTKKIFVGGLPHTLTEEGFIQYFQAHGRVTDVVIMRDRNTQISRGFGFIFFDSEDIVDRVLHKRFHELNGKFVEVKRGLPEVTYGGNYEAQMDSNRYMQPQTTGGGFPAYGSSSAGYGGPAVAYGNSNALNASYVSDPPDVPRIISSNQIPSSLWQRGL